MSLINCPECGHDVSAAAVACPNCGRPLQNRTVPPRPAVVAHETTEKGVPPWAYAIIGITAVLLLFFLFMMVNRDGDDDTANTNIRVRAETDRRSATSRDTEVSANPSSDSLPSNDPTVNSEMPTSESTIPGSQASIPSTPTKGVVKIDAKVVTRNGNPQAVKNEKFYLLEKDLEMILSDAELKPIEGNTLTNSFGLSVMFPERYGSFRSEALAAINKHIEYSGTTDAAGKAELTGVDPGSYYLFGITKTPTGFALWSSPVSVIAGDNVLNLAPQRVSEMERSSE